MIKKLLFFCLILNSHSTNAKQTSSIKLATFAGGCFWCMEPPFEKVDGVISVISGYAGGVKTNPSYYQVSSGKTNHLEVVQVTYESKKITYKNLLKIFWQNVNPTDSGGQFVDRGPQYSTAIFYHSKKQKELANISKDKLKKAKIYKQPIITPIREFKSFYPAEDYHQDFYKKSLISKTKYKYYRAASGRDKFINVYKKRIESTLQD